MGGGSKYPCGTLLPLGWIVIENRRNPRAELTTLYRDMAMARARLEQALQDLASRHGIAANRITNAMETHADDLLNAVVADLKCQLTRNIES